MSGALGMSETVMGLEHSTPVDKQARKFEADVSSKCRPWKPPASKTSTLASRLIRYMLGSLDVIQQDYGWIELHSSRVVCGSDGSWIPFDRECPSTSYAGAPASSSWWQCYGANCACILSFLLLAL